MLSCALPSARHQCAASEGRGRHEADCAEGERNMRSRRMLKHSKNRRIGSLNKIQKECILRCPAIVLNVKLSFRNGGIVWRAFARKGDNSPDAIREERGHHRFHREIKQGPYFAYHEKSQKRKHEA